MNETEKRRRFKFKDAEEVSEVFEALSTHIPNMIRSILDSLFSPEAAANMGKAIAEFYKKLKEGGIPEEDAMEMTKGYLSTLTKWSEMMKGARFGPTVTEHRHRRKEKEE